MEGKTIEAKVVIADAEKVVLLIGAKKIPYPLAQLCEEDREYVSGWLERYVAGELEPEEETGAPAGDTSPRTPRDEVGAAASAPLSSKVPTSSDKVPDFKVETVKEDAAEMKFVYRSPHFVFESDRRLTSRVVRGFATIYEATYEAIRKMPWGISLGSKEGMDSFPVRLFTDEEAFTKAGGIPGSAGTAVGSTSLALTKHLGVRDTGSRLILEEIEDNHTLIHELTHAIRDFGDRPLPIWAIEGFAEYMASAPYRREGRFNFKDRLEDGVSYVRMNKGVGTAFRFPVKLEALLDADRSTFYQSEGGGLGKGALPFYAAALLTMNYFWHVDQRAGDPEPGKRIRAWLDALGKGAKESEARKLLLDGRSYEEIEKEMVKAYRRHLSIEFP